MKISLKGFGENAATFKFTGVVSQGQPVTMADNFTVKPCEKGDNIIGTALNAKGEYSSVQLTGYAEFGYSGTAPEVGMCTLSGDGKGNVCVSDTGRQFIVTNVDTDNSRVGIIL